MKRLFFVLLTLMMLMVYMVPVCAESLALNVSLDTVTSIFDDVVNVIFPSGDMPKIKHFCGNYGPPNAEDNTFLSKWQTMKQAVTATENDDGTLRFLEMDLLQIAPGVFVDAAGDPDVPVVQFLLNEEGEVTSIETREGACFVPLRFYQSGVFAKILYYALLLCTAFFVLYGLVGMVRWLVRRAKSEKAPSFLSLAPSLFSGVLGVLVSVILFLTFKNGVAQDTALYTNMSFWILLTVVLATVSFVLNFFTSLFHRKRHHRIAHTAMVFVLYLLLIVFWGIIVI